MAKSPTTITDFEKKLKERAFADGELTAMAKALAGLDATPDVSLDEVNVLGIVQPDVIKLTVDAMPGRLDQVVKAISGLGRADVKIFPLGIVVTDRFRVEADVRRR